MRSTVAAKFGWSSGIAGANTTTVACYKRTMNILVLWGVKIEHMHNFEETLVSLWHVVQENEKPGRKAANINTKKLRRFITVRLIVQ